MIYVCVYFWTLILLICISVLMSIPYCSFFFKHFILKLFLIDRYHKEVFYALYLDPVMLTSYLIVAYLYQLKISIN